MESVYHPSPLPHSRFPLACSNTHNIIPRSCWTCFWTLLVRTNLKKTTDTDHEDFNRSCLPPCRSAVVRYVYACLPLLPHSHPFSRSLMTTQQSLTRFFRSLPFSFLSITSAPASQVQRSTALFGAIPDSDLSAEAKEIRQIQEKWSEIRHYDRATAESKLEGEWLEAYNSFYQQYDDDMKRMEEIVENLKSYIDPPRVQKKTKGQKRRDALARKLERSGQSA